MRFNAIIFGVGYSYFNELKNKTMKKEMHLVMVATGSYDDYNESSMFVTEDKEKALLWVEKYNKIIKDNTDRIERYVFKEGQEKEPFWYWLINYEQPNAMVRQVEHRP